MIPFEERIEVVRRIKYVDVTVLQHDMGILKACKERGL